MNADEPPDDLMSAREAARLAKAHVGTIHRWRQAGQVRAWRRGHRWFFSRAEILGLFRQQEVRPPAPGGSSPRSWVEAELRRHGMRD